MIGFFSLFSGRLAVVMIAGVVMLSPWLFGAWEMWYFWPFAGAIFLATGVFGLHLVLRAAAEPAAAVPRARWLCVVAAYLPFLAYAGVRAATSPVFMDAERSFLLLLTPLLVGLIVCGTVGAQARQALLVLLAINLLSLGVYGLANHILNGNRYVLWEPGFPQYVNDNRATGSYYCPDHFAGIMEIGVCVGIGFLMHVRHGLGRLGGLALIVLGVLGVVLSKSRGGGLTLIAAGGAALIWGLVHLPPAVRRWWRVSAAAALVAMAALTANFADAYMHRYASIFNLDAVEGKPLFEVLTHVATQVNADIRPQMYYAAWRAWRSAPWFGVGAGMHENLWLHFGPSPDGDRARGRWPTFPNYALISNAVHNDWLQVLEEYGAVGFALLAVCFIVLWLALVRAVNEGAYAGAASGRRRDNGLDDAARLAALLAVVAMAAHALVDFNLQIPATTWFMAALVAIPLSLPARATGERSGRK